MVGQMRGQMEAAPGVEEVYRRLLDRILTGFYPAQSRLPTCRSLAAELGSNSSTVDRAISRLVAAGRVRTIPRRGSFVQPLDAAVVDAGSIIAADLEEVLLRARRLGFGSADLTEMVAESLSRVDSMRRIALVECNERDLRSLQQMVAEASGVEVQPVLLGDIGDRMLDVEFDAVACPIFHLNDIANNVTAMDQVVELSLVASPRALRRLVDLRTAPELTVVAPSDRGLQWMTALVGQYYPGQIHGLDPHQSDESELIGRSVVVVNNAATLSAEVAGSIEHLVPIEWELDARFVPVLRSRIDHAITTTPTPTHVSNEGVA